MHIIIGKAAGGSLGVVPESPPGNVSCSLFGCSNCFDTDVVFREMQKLKIFATDFGLTQRQAVCTQRCLEFLKAKMDTIDKIFKKVQSTLDPDYVVLVNTGWA